MTDMAKKYRLTRSACYSAGFSMSAATNLSALLFVPFHELYGISFSQLGFLVLVNFCTQLMIDLVFTFFSKKFNLTKTIKSIPAVVLVGFMIYTLVPMAFPGYTYVALVAGTFVFSLGAGLGEVLTSPVIAAIPSENPEREMSKLHSAYAWGTVVVVIVSTFFIKFAGSHNWMYLVLLWSIVPVVSLVLFLKAEIPDINLGGEEGGLKKSNRFGIMLCTLCIFFGGAAEMTMTQWISGFAEKALGISKVYGDVFGMALFAFALGFGRTIYSMKGKSIYPILLGGMGLSAICYVAAALTENSIIGLVVCVLTGFFTAMLWPGTIVYVNEKYISCGVGIYALLAAGGDLGASISPQLMGIITDKVAVSSLWLEKAASMGISGEQMGMKVGMLVAATFPLLGFLLLLYMKKYFSKQKNT